MGRPSCRNIKWILDHYKSYTFKRRSQLGPEESLLKQQCKVCEELCTECTECTLCTELILLFVKRKNQLASEKSLGKQECKVCSRLIRILTPEMK